MTKTRKSPFERAVEFGRIAHRDGVARTDNPYRDKRKWDGRLTWSRAWSKAWDDGWTQAASKVTP